MKKSFKLFLAAAFLVTEFFVVALPLMITSAKADGHPIQAITHAGFGGGTDVTTRMMLLRTRRYLKQDMQLVNKKGGGGAASMDYIYTEINRAEVYENTPHVDELDTYLKPYGFTRVESDWTGDTWGDGLYIKEKSNV